MLYKNQSLSVTYVSVPSKKSQCKKTQKKPKHGATCCAQHQQLGKGQRIIDGHWTCSFTNSSECTNKYI